MFTADIKFRVEEIREKAKVGDDEAATVLERNLFVAFIESMTNTGSLVINDEARQVLKSLDIDFYRGAI